MPFKKGEVSNPNGRPRKPEVELIRQAIEEVSAKKKKSLWIHLIEQCFEDNTVLVAVGKKFIPEKIEADIKDKRFILLPPGSKVEHISLNGNGNGSH